LINIDLQRPIDSRSDSLPVPSTSVTSVTSVTEDPSASTNPDQTVTEVTRVTDYKGTPSPQQRLIISICISMNIQYAPTHINAYWTSMNQSIPVCINQEEGYINQSYRYASVRIDKFEALLIRS
jgi:ubiquinone/menaquinone biosynthesis C-methylase UbiE